MRHFKKYEDEDDPHITSEEEFKQKQLKIQSESIYNFRLIRDVCTYLLDKEVGNQTKVDKLKRKLAKSDAAAASEVEPPKKKKKKDKKA